MNTERNGGMPEGDASEAKLKARLGRHFDAELTQAERDYSALSVSRRTSSVGKRAATGRIWPRLASAVVALGVFAVLVLIGVGLASKPGVVGSGGQVPLASDGIPTQIDGRQVYRVRDRASFPTDGVYLVGGYVFEEPSCPAGAEAVPPPCFGLASGPGPDASSGGLDLGGFREGSGWVGSSVVVLMANCTWDNGTPCHPAPKSVEWPEVPAQLNGERVYRAVDQASFPAAGSFLLGGRVSKPDLVPPCPMRMDLNTAEQQLIPYCYIVTIDGLSLAPKSNIDEPKNEIVVARVHVDDALAAQCTAKNLADCKAAIAVESVVWRSDVLVNAATPGASQSQLLPNGSPGGVSVPSTSAGPVGTGQGVGPVSLPPVGSTSPASPAAQPSPWNTPPAPPST